MAPEASLQYGTLEYELVPPGDRRREFVDRGDYDRVEGRTDDFLVYYGRVKVADRARLVLHSPRTIATTANEKTIAEKIAPWHFGEVLTQDALAQLTAAEQLPTEYKDMLWYDGKVEGDSTRFFNEVVRNGKNMPDDLWPVLLLWLRDEANHSAGFRAVYDALYGPDAQRRAQDDAETANFEPLRDIMHDPFALLINLAYDELLTIQGYSKHLERYLAIGPACKKFVQRVMADEGWHLQKFLKLAVRHYGNRASDVDAVLALGAQADETAYGNTFIFDRGDSAGAKQTELETRTQARDSVKKLFLRMCKASGPIRDTPPPFPSSEEDDNLRTRKSTRFG